MQLITATNSHPITTSLVIAETFAKDHSVVLRAIRNLEFPKEFITRNFALVKESITYIDSRGNEISKETSRTGYYEITRDGFALLAMGFTGKKAAEWKVKFLEAFNLMEQTLLRQQQKSALSWNQARGNGKVVRLSFTDGVQDFIDYARAQGSKHADKYYMQLTKMENQALFLIGQAVGDGFRDKLNVAQLTTLCTAEIIAQRALNEGMQSGLHYKDIYKLAKHRVESFAASIGKSLPGERFGRIASAA